MKIRNWSTVVGVSACFFALGIIACSDSDPGAQAQTNSDDEHEVEYADMVPSGFEGVNLNDELDGEETMTSVEFDFLETTGRVAPLLDEEGRVEQLVAAFGTDNLDWSDASLFDDDGGEALLSQIEERLIEAFGEPHERGRGNAHERGPDNATVWYADGRILKFYTTVTVEGVAETRMPLMVDRPDRLCGPEDGFDAWYEDFRQALERAYEEDAPEEVVDYFEFPIVDPYLGVEISSWLPERSVSETLSPEGLEQLEADQRDRIRSGVAFRDEAHFLENFSDIEEDMRPYDSAEPKCRRIRGQYELMALSGGDYIIERRNGTWKVTGTAWRS